MGKKELCRIRKILLTVLIFVCCFSFLGFADEKEVIRIGFPEQAGLTEINEDGSYSGYTYEYLMEIAQYNGWKYEFVQAPGDINESLQALLAMLQRGEIDMMGGMLYDDSMAEIYDYAGYSYGDVYTVLSVLEDDPATNVMARGLDQSLKVAVTTSMSVRLQEMENYCRLNRINTELVYCEDYKGQVEALREGKADVLLSVSMAKVEGTKPIAKFSSRPFFFITTKGNDELVQGINSAIANIEQVDPYFSTTLYEKYFAAESKKLLLSDRELDYIHKSGKIRAGVSVSAPPFQYRNGRTGEMKGIGTDLLTYVEEQTGLQFEFIEAQNQEELYQMMENQEIDLIVATTYDTQLSQKMNISLTKPYVTAQYVMVANNKVNEGSLAGRKLAITADSGIAEPCGEDILQYPDVESCIRAVNEGSADYTYCDSYEIQYYLNRPEYNKLRMVSQTFDPRRISMGVKMPGNRELLSILNKVIMGISSEKLQMIIYENTIFEYHFSISDMVKQNPIEVITITSVFLLSIIVILGWGLRTRTKMNQKISMDLKKYFQVFEMSSERFMEYNFKTGELMISIQNKAGEGDFAHFTTYQLSEFEKKDAVGEDGLLEKFRKLLETEVTGELYVPDQEGGKHWIRIVLKRICDDNGEPAYAIGKITRIDEEKKEKENLLAKAQRDSLTSLYNKAFTEQMIHEYLDSEAGLDHAAFLILDLDHFKDINDTYGHPFGDSVLVKLAEILKGTVRSDDIVGRYGGDEFVIFLKNIKTREDVEGKCKELCSAVKSADFGCGRAITVSMGGVIADGTLSYGELYEKADKALYQKKNTERGGFAIF